MPAARRAWAEKGAYVCNRQVRGHTFPPQGACTVSVPAGQEGSHVRPVPSRGARSGAGAAGRRSRSRKLTELRSGLRSALRPLPARSAHTSDPMVLTSLQGELTFLMLGYSCFLFWKTQTPSE